MNEEKRKMLIELMEELIFSTVRDDAKIKDNDKSIDPTSISQSTHLAITAKQLIDEEFKQ